MARLPSPSTSRRSVALPMRQHFAPKSAGSSPHAAAMRFLARAYFTIFWTHFTVWVSPVQMPISLSR
eukprot:2955443-Pleurochrysis_carterae.AAC.1